MARWRRAPGSPSGNYRYRPATRTSTESADWRSRPGRCPRASGYPTLLPPAEGARGVQCLLSPPASAGEGAPGVFFPFKPSYPSTNVATHGETENKNNTTLSGGSLGSCVDEERS